MAIQMFREKCILAFLCATTFLFIVVPKLYKWTSKWEQFTSPHKEMTLDEVMLSLSWAPSTSNLSSFKKSSHAQSSVVRLEHPRAQYCVGDTLNVLVEMRNYAGHPKTYGGDFILARIHSPKLKACASGDITDFFNGSYRIRFRLFWPGEVQVSVRLIHSSETVKILQRDWMQDYYKIMYTGTFIREKELETSLCALRLSSDQPLCEYGKKEDGGYYACYQPNTLPCNSLFLMRAYIPPDPYVTKLETELLNQSNAGVNIKNHFDPVIVHDCTGAANMPHGKCVAGMNSTFPGGYFNSSRWSSSFCQTGSFLSEVAIRRCLKGKTLYLLGDSTARQWIEYLEQKLKGLRMMEKTQNVMLAVDAHNKITVQWVRHSHPWIAFYHFAINGSVNIPEALDRIAVDGRQEDMIVVIGIGQHFRPFPPKVFIRRLLGIRQAVLRLQARNTLAHIVIKLENNRNLDLRTIYLSNWYGYIQNLAQRKVFEGMKVALVDAWDMSVAADSMALHPDEVIVSNELAVALSYFCH